MNLHNPVDVRSHLLKSRKSTLLFCISTQMKLHQLPLAYVCNTKCPCLPFIRGQYCMILLYKKKYIVIALKKHSLQRRIDPEPCTTVIALCMCITFLKFINRPWLLNHIRQVDNGFVLVNRMVCNRFRSALSDRNAFKTNENLIK